MRGVAAETLLVAGYAGFLVIAAGLLDLAARHTHERADRFRVAGFEYDERLDAWRCGEGEHLQRVETDPVARLIRYRARAHVCNACPSKGDCTDSDLGREVARPLDPWPRSEAGRFHRGICLVLLALASVLLTLELVRHHTPGDAALAGAMLGIVIVLAIRAAGSFRATPANFPPSGAAAHAAVPGSAASVSATDSLRGSPRMPDTRGGPRVRRVMFDAGGNQWHGDR